MSTEYIDRLNLKYKNCIIDSHSFRGDQTITVNKEAIIELFKFIRDDPKLDFKLLMDLTAVDYLRRKKNRFEMVYHFYSLSHNGRLRVKIPISEDDCSVDSVSSLWKTANWYEREVWDLYGIKFNGHPDMRRILLYEEFKGHPLRKDYPINKRQPLIGPLN
mgnify:FL=1